MTPRASATTGSRPSPAPPPRKRSAPGPRAQRLPLAVEAHLVLERAAVLVRGPVVDPVRVALVEGVGLLRGHLRAGVGEERGVAREGRGRRVRRARLVARAERQHLPPALS